MRGWAWWIVAGLAGCSSGEDTAVKESAEDTQDGACGDVSTYDVVIRAQVERGGRAAAGVRVYLDDRAWELAELGEGTTGADGTVTFTAAGVTSVDGCWGTLLDYWIVAEDTDGATVEDDMNTELFNAIDDGSLEADVTTRPLSL